MSQDYNTVAKKPRRTRVPRNRPVLVTGTETQEEISTPTTDDLAMDTAPAIEEVASAPAAPKRALRLPKFFSKVEHNETDTPTDKSEVVEARMARAKKNLGTKGKSATVQAETAAENTKQVTKNKPATKPSLFKPRHILGMVIYLFGANVLLPVEANLAKSTHIERTLFKIAQFPLTVSFALNIITLIVLLYALVALDLLPNGKQYGNSQLKAKNAKTSNTPNSSTPKVAPLTMRPGVKGEHDDLYQAYRNGQRKKR